MNSGLFVSEAWLSGLKRAVYNRLDRVTARSVGSNPTASGPTAPENGFQGR